jgi:hypothetical protein
MVEKVENGTNVVLELLGEGQGFSAHAAHALPQRVIEAFDVIRLPSRFADDLVALGGENARVGLPEVGVADGTHPIVRRERLPESASGLCTSLTNRYPNDFPRFSIQC